MTLSIKASKRETFGKKMVKDRAVGQLPIVIYGRKEPNAPFFVDSAEFKKVFKEAGESTIIQLKTDSGDKDALIHEVQFHPVTGDPIHVDFYAIEKDKKVEVDVPLVFEGESPAVKGLGGILVKVMHELTIEALPKDLPHEIKVDISSLVDFETQIHVKDISLPAGVEAQADPEEVVALVDEAREEEAEEDSAGPDLASIEVEKKGKKEEEGEAEA